MSFPLEISIKINGKIIYGEASINEMEFEFLKRQDRWDLERFLRKTFTEMAHGIVEQIYLHDGETVLEGTLKGEVAPPSIATSSIEVTKLIESLPLLTHEPLIGNPDKIQEG